MSRRSTNTSLVAPKAILFDWDNTLVDTWPVIGMALNETFRHMGHDPWTDAEVRERVGGSLRDTFPALFGDRWEEAGEIYHATFNAKHLEALAVLPGAEQAIKTVANAGVYTGIVSNKTGPALRKEIEHLGWSGYFGQVVGATDAAKDKPAADPVLMALEPAGLEPGADVWFVGDTPTDMECAKNAGCTAILVHAEMPNPGRYRGIMPQAHVADLASWTELFEALNR